MTLAGIAGILEAVAWVALLASVLTAMVVVPVIVWFWWRCRRRRR